MDLRLPFGISSAPEVFHRIIADYFSDIPGVYTYIDDILVAGSTIEEHDSRLKQVLTRCRQINLGLNAEKCRFGHTEIPYLGHVLSASGIKPDPAKVQAINDLPVPSPKADVLRFLGMANYLAKFCPKLSEVSTPLRHLTQTDVPWCWDANHTKAFEQVKRLVVEAPLLGLFDVNRPVTLSVDASQHGLGAVLLQNGQPIAYASRTLTPVQQRYAQIEKEMMAIQFGLERFHQYVFGQNLIVESDHKPLLGIMSKPIAEVSPRLQRMRLRCLPYHFVLIHKPGKELIIADALSRAPCKELYSDHEWRDEEQIAAVLHQTLPAFDQREACRQATSSDPTLQALQQYILTGWPDRRKQLPAPLRPYWGVRHDLTTHSGLVFKSDQVVIPRAFRQQALQYLHEGHFGIVKCMLLAKSTMYWPGYVNDVEDMVASCSKCQENRAGNPPMPSMVHSIPRYPFQKVAADIFHLDGSDYLLTVDYYSKWVTIDTLSALRSQDVIQILDIVFANFGIPEELVSDNGPQFACAELREFASSLGIRLITSSPNYPQSNGQAERFVQTAKATMLKMFSDGKSLSAVLRAIRNMPVGDGLPTPAKLLQGRQLRTRWPLNEKDLLPCLAPPSIVRQLLSARQRGSDSTRRQYAVLMPGEKVRVRAGKKWIPAEVVDHHSSPRSYVLRLANGQQIRRNRSAINRTAEPWATSPSNLPASTRSSAVMTPVYPTRTSTAAAHAIPLQPREGCGSGDSNSQLVVDGNGGDSATHDLCVPPSPLEQNSAAASPAEPIPDMTTRSGRILRRPNYLHDYVQ